MGQDLGSTDGQDSRALGQTDSDRAGPPPIPGNGRPGQPGLPVEPATNVTADETCPPTRATEAGPWPEVDVDKPLYWPRLFFQTDMPMWRYILTMGPISLIPSLAIGFALAKTGVLTEESGPQFEGPRVLMFIGITVFSPVVETLIMAGILWLCSFVTGNKTKLAIMSVIVWAVFHSLYAPLWGVVVAWPFFVFSCGYLAWREKSVGHGLLVATGLHFFQNIFPGLLLLFGAG